MINTRSVGAALRLSREAAGISLSGMAARTHYSRSHLCNVEAGRKLATPDVVLAYERALGEDMDRRGLLTGVAAGVVAPVAASELLRRGFAAALSGKAADDDWHERAEGYGHDYMALGAPEMQDRLSGDLIVLQQHLESSALWSTAARLLTIWGKVSKGSRESISWYRLAATAADRSGDDSVSEWVRGRAAIALAYEGAALPVAMTLADQALSVSERPSLGRVNAYLATAHVHALRGDTAFAVKALEDARRTHDAVGSCEQVSDFAIPEWRFEIMSGLAYARIGDESRAVKAQETVEATRPLHLVRFATHIELHRGLMMAKAGDRPGGVAYAKAALDRLAPEKRSQSLRLMLAEIERS